MGTLKIQMGGYVRERILSNTGIFSPVVGETQKAALDGKPVNLKTGDAESQIEVSPDSAGRTAVFIYPLDNDPENSNGRLYAEDRFVFDPEGKTLIQVKRSFRMGSGAAGSAYWGDLYGRLKKLETDSPLRKEDPQVQKFFKDVVLSLPEPTEGAEEEPALPASPSGTAPQPVLPPIKLGAVRPAPSISKSQVLRESREAILSQTQELKFQSQNLLRRSRATLWSEAARGIDQTVARFFEGLSDPIVLGSLLAGSAAFRAGEAVLLNRAGGWFGAHPIFSKVLATVSGLAVEAPVFELASRKFQSIGAGQETSSPLWRWNGTHGLGQGFLRSYLTFGAFRSSHGILNPVVKRMAESGFTPYGRWTVPVFSHGGSLATLHGINEIERNLHLREREGEWGIRLFSDAVFYTQMVFAGSVVEKILGPKVPIAFDFSAKKAKETPKLKVSSMQGELAPELMQNLEQSVPLVQEPATKYQGPFAMISTQGIGRGINEDLVLQVTLPTREHYYVAVDGMGGHEAGEVAARLTGFAFQTEIVRSNNMPRAWKLANDAIYLYNLTKREGGTSQDAMAAAHQLIMNPPEALSLPDVTLRFPTGAVATALKISPSSQPEGPSAAEFQWIGDARGTIFRRGADGNWHWIYRTVDESIAYHPGVGVKAGQDFAVGGAGRTLAAMRHGQASTVINALGQRPTLYFKSTSHGELFDPHHENGARPAQEYLNGIALEKGDLVLLGSDGFWENFGHTRYIENFLNHFNGPNALLEALTREAHRKMARYEEANRFFEANPGATRYDLTIDGLRAWIDPEGTVFNEHNQAVDHYKTDNFSLIAYLHEPGAVSEAPKRRSVPPTVPDLPAPPESRSIPPTVPDFPAAPEKTAPATNPADTTQRLLKPGGYFAATEENRPEHPRRNQEALNLSGTGEVSAFTHEGLLPFAHSKFDGSPVNPDAFGFALDSQGRTFLMAAQGLGPQGEESGALAVAGLMEGFSKGSFSSISQALELAHPLVLQKTGGGWEGGLVSVERDGRLEAALEGDRKIWILRAGDEGLLEPFETGSNQEVRLNPSDTLLLLNPSVGALLDSNAVAQSVQGKVSVDEIRGAIEEKASRRQKMRRDFGPNLNLGEEGVRGPLTALVYRHRPDSPTGVRGEEGAKIRGILPSIFLPPVPLTRPMLNPSEAPEVKICESGARYLGIDPNFPGKPRRAEHTLLIPFLGEISAMTHEGIDKHVLMLNRAHAVNEDGYGVFVDQKGRPVLMVADGMGGYELGDVASARAIEGAFSTLADGQASLGDAFIAAHRHIQAHNARRQVEWKDAGKVGPQPTLARAVASAARVNIDGSVEVALVGDARIWVLRPRASGAYDVVDPYPPDSFTGNLMAGGLLKNILEMNAHPNANEVAGCLGHDTEPRVVENLQYQKFWGSNPYEYQVLNAFLALPKSPGNYGERLLLRLRKGDSLLLMSDGVAEIFDPELLAETIRDQKTAEGIRSAVERKTHELLSLYQDRAFGLKSDELKELPDGRFINGRGDLFNSSSPIKRLVGHVGPDNVVALVYTHQRETSAEETHLQGATPSPRSMTETEERRARPTPADNMAVGPVPPQFVPILVQFRDSIQPEILRLKPGDDGVRRSSYQIIRDGETYRLVAEKDMIVPMDGETLGTLNFAVLTGELPVGKSRFEFTAEELQAGSIPREILQVFSNMSQRSKRQQGH